MSSKLREALEKAGVALSWATHGHLTEDDAKECLEVVDSALAEPIRNYEVGTEKEQHERLVSFCVKHFRYANDNPCAKCPLKDDSLPCVYRFLQMPYEKGEAE